MKTPCRGTCIGLNMRSEYVTGGGQVKPGKAQTINIGLLITCWSVMSHWVLFLLTVEKKKNSDVT